MTNFVQDFRSTDQNAPIIAGRTGNLTDALDQLLGSNGYGGSAALSITGITRSGATATATLAAANLTMKTGNLVTVSGAAETEYNITASITVTSTTTFTYTVAGTPATPATGTIVGDWRLPITSISRSGSTATATLANANTTLRTGNMLNFVGADQPEYNGLHQITVTDSTHFTYQVSGTPTTPATGTIKYQKAGLQWDTEFTGTNKRVFRSPDTGSNRFRCRIDDNATTSVLQANVRGYESMSDVDTGTGAFPTVVQQANGLYWNKSASADATARAYTLVGDDKTFYLSTTPGIGTQPQVTFIFGFGHYSSYKPSDGYNTFLGGSLVTAFTDSSQGAVGQTSPGLQHGTTWGATAYQGGPMYGARDFSQSGSAVGMNCFDGRQPSIGNSAGGTFGQATGSGVAGGIPYPNGPDSGLWVSPVFVVDFAGAKMNVRGRLPGYYSSLHSGALPQNNYDIVTGVVGLSGVTLLAVLHHTLTANNSVQSGLSYFDLTGPW